MSDIFLDLKNTKSRAISLGSDEMSEYDFKELPCDITVIIYHYEDGGYDGSGMALCKNDKGLWTYISLSHCSCYGPLEKDERWNKENFKTLEETWDSISDSYEKRFESVYEKAKEFIN